MESVRKENLAAFIKSNRGSQKEIAKALGITSPTISEWKTGKRAVPAEHIPVICEILGCSKADLCQPFMNLRVELDKKSPRQMFAGDLFASLPDVDQEDIIAMMIERKHRLAGQTE